LESRKSHQLPGFRKRFEWFLKNRPELAKNISIMMATHDRQADKALLAVTSRSKLERILKYVLDENEFLSPYGIRSLSKYHLTHPFSIYLGGDEHRVAYVPGESDTALFGGNSNWRGPVWFPINFLLLEALQKYHYFFGHTFTIEFPTGSGKKYTLDQIATFLANRMVNLFKVNAQGVRPLHGQDRYYAENPYFKDLFLFYEYFHGDHGQGLGASHQTGWTALVAKLLDVMGRYREHESLSPR